ncbi:hypothetical protein Bhyg_06281, partial [Pseudolycoriella hygida]
LVIAILSTKVEHFWLSSHKYSSTKLDQGIKIKTTNKEKLLSVDENFVTIIYLCKLYSNDSI